MFHGFILKPPTFHNFKTANVEAGKCCFIYIMWFLAQKKLWNIYRKTTGFVTLGHFENLQEKRPQIL